MHDPQEISDITPRNRSASGNDQPGLSPIPEDPGTGRNEPDTDPAPEDAPRPLPASLPPHHLPSRSATEISLPTQQALESSPPHLQRGSGEPSSQRSPGGTLMRQIRSLARRVSKITAPPTLAPPVSRSVPPTPVDRRQTLMAAQGAAARQRPVHAQEYKPLPRYIGAYKERVLAWEGVQFLWRIISEAQTVNPLGDIAIGLSGGTSPKKTLEAFANMCGAVAGTVCLPRQHSGASFEVTAESEATSSTPPPPATPMTGVPIAWSRVKLFLVDERYVPPTDPASNQRMFRETLLGDGLVPIPEENLVFPDTSMPLEECVDEYNTRLRDLLTSVGGRPTLVTLGLGDDGHIASWFPPMSPENYAHAYSPDALAFHTTQDRGLDVRDRITVSMRVITSAAEKLFVLSGASKVETWKRLLGIPIREHIKQQPLLQVLDSGNVTVLSYPPIAPDVFTEICDVRRTHLTVVVFGASGDLARKKTIPALFSLFCEGHLPEDVHIVGFARTAMTSDEYWNTVEPHLWTLESFFKGSARHQEALFKQATPGFLEEFKKRLVYVSGSYDAPEGFAALGALLDTLETPVHVPSGCDIGNRMFYLALPPTVFLSAIRRAKEFCWTSRGWNRIVIEKPFGRDLQSASQLADAVLNVIEERETFRIDHYLGKEMVLNLMTFRFANAAFAPLMSWHYVAAVRITFKETIGVAGRGAYFNQFGIIRDIIQNHILQILTIVAMERPASLRDDDVRDEKVKVLKQIAPFRLSETVVGQYTRSADGATPGYQDDHSLPSGSLCPTFCAMVLHIQNERWAGVPFILKAGKALEERLTEVRIQLRSVPGNLFGSDVPRNELVIRIQPAEAIYIKVVSKNPGLARGLRQTELDFTMMDRCDIERLPDAYERLLVDVIKGDKQNFVRTDELLEAWRIFTPGLHELESRRIKPIPYPANSRGPDEAYELIKRHGYTRYEGYTWERIS